jgi:hypothetical protein
MRGVKGGLRIPPCLCLNLVRNSKLSLKVAGTREIFLDCKSKPLLLQMVSKSIGLNWQSPSMSLIKKPASILYILYKYLYTGWVRPAKYGQKTSQIVRFAQPKFLLSQPLICLFRLSSLMIIVSSLGISDEVSVNSKVPTNSLYPGRTWK